MKSAALSPSGKASSKPKSRRSLENPNGSPARRVTTFACAYDGVVGAIHDPLQRGTAINACGATCSCCHQGTFMNSDSCARKQNSLHLHPVGALNAGANVQAHDWRLGTFHAPINTGQGAALKLPLQARILQKAGDHGAPLHAEHPASIEFERFSHNSKIHAQ